MTIYEYCTNLIETMDFDEAVDTIATMYACYEADFDDFCMWAIENGIDVDAMDARTGEAVLTLWAWDQCGD